MNSTPITIRKGVLLLVALMGLSLPGCSHVSIISPAPTPGYSLYRHEKKRFQTEFPSRWMVMENRNNLDVAFVSPPENSSDFIKENIGIKAQQLDVEGPVNMDQVMKDILLRYAAMLDDVKLLTGDKISVAGREGYYWVLKGGKKGYILKMMQVVVRRESQFVVITYAAEEKSYDTYLPEMNHVIRTFELF